MINLANIKDMWVDGEKVVEQRYEFVTREFDTTREDFEMNVENEMINSDLSPTSHIIPSYIITSEEEILDSDYIVMQSIADGMYYGQLIWEFYEMNNYGVLVNRIDEHTIEIVFTHDNLNEYYNFDACIFAMNIFLAHDSDTMTIYPTHHIIQDIVLPTVTFEQSINDFDLETGEPINLVNINQPYVQITSDTKIEPTHMIQALTIDGEWWSLIVGDEIESGYAVLDEETNTLTLYEMYGVAGIWLVAPTQDNEFTPEGISLIYVSYQDNLLTKQYFLPEGIHEVKWTSFMNAVNDVYINSDGIVEWSYDAVRQYEYPSYNIYFSDINGKRPNLQTLNVPCGRNMYMDNYNKFPSLEYINVEYGHEQYFSHPNNVLVTKNGDLILGCKNTKIASYVKTIGAYAFQGQTMLTSIDIPYNVSQIGKNAFDGCTNLQTINVAPNSLVKSFEDNPFESTMYYNSLKYETNRYVGPWLMECYGVQDVTVKEGTTLIRNFGKNGNEYSGLRRIVLPDSLYELPSFKGCKNLEEIVLPNTITTIPHACFSGCSQLKSIVIPDSVTSIGDDAFSYCTQLEKVILGKNVTSIGSCAFYHTRRLEHIECKSQTAPSFVTDTFSGMTFNGKLEYPIGSDYSSWLSTDNYKLGYYYWNENLGDYKNLDLRLNGYDIVCVHFISSPSTKTLNKMGNIIQTLNVNGVDITTATTSSYTFDSKGLHVIRYKLNDNATSIPASGFTNLGHLIYCEVGEKITTLGARAFYNCGSLQELILSDSIKTIGGYCIYGCEKLHNIKLPNNITQLPISGLAYNYALKTINLPESIARIGNGCFIGCYSLESLTLPPQLTAITQHTFNYCYSLTSITIPSRVSSISVNSSQCTKKLSQIIVDESNSVYDSRNNCNAIIETNTNKLIIGCLGTIIPNSVTSIASSAFANMYDLTEITIPSSVKSIASSAFTNCLSLTKIVFEGMTAPTCNNNSFVGMPYVGVIYAPKNSTGYDSILSTLCQKYTNSKLDWEIQYY